MRIPLAGIVIIIKNMDIKFINKTAILATQRYKNIKLSVLFTPDLKQI
jgi:hypothetical protein